MPLTKMYLHAATTTDTGTLPSTKLGTDTINVTATGATTNRAMNGTIGTAQTSIAIASLAQTTTQKYFMGRWVSPPLATQVVASGTWQMNIAISQSSTSASFGIGWGWLGFWRPSTGAIVTTLLNVLTNELTISVTGEVSFSTSVAEGSVSIQDGDIVVFEMVGAATQGMATSFTDTLFFDGTTEGSNTSNAGYVAAPAAMLLLGESPFRSSRIASVQAAVRDAATRCWKRRESGIVVPRLWTPEGAAV